VINKKINKYIEGHNLKIEGRKNKNEGNEKER
jgi:hypothetical protein